MRHRTQNSLAIAGVAAILGLLLVVQLRSQAGNPGLEALSAQELTVLVANLNTRNDQLRTEIASLDQEVRGLTDGQARGQTSVGQLQLDLSRVKAWSGLSPVTGQGVRITVAGPISGNAIQDLLNELRNAGAEALAIEGIRVVGGSVVAGVPDQLVVEGASLPRSLRDQRHRQLRDAHGHPDAIGRDRRPAGGHVPRRAAHGHPGDESAASRNVAVPHARSWPSDALIRCPADDHPTRARAAARRCRPAAEAAPVRRARLARRPPGSRHRPPLPDVRSPRPARATRRRGPARGVRQPGRPGDECGRRPRARIGALLMSAPARSTGPA